MNFIKFSCLTFICLLCLNFETHKKPLTVVIDAGHGGKDPGAVINDFQEKDITQAISQKIKNLENSNVNIILIRQEDSFISLKERVEKINEINPDLVISLHLDNNIEDKNSTTKAYIFKNKAERKSHFYASRLLTELEQDKSQVGYTGFYILKHTKAPAVNLTIGNFSHEEDYLFLTSGSGQKHIAKQIFAAFE